MWDDPMDPRLRAWLDAVEAHWRRTGVSALSRHKLGRALELDLHEALASGATVPDLIESDPFDFAERLAAAEGRTAGPAEYAVDPTPARVAVTTVGGAVAGVLTVWFVVWPLLFSRTETLSDDALVAIAYPLGAVVVLLGSFVALRIRFGGGSQQFPRAVPAVAGLVVGVLLGLPATLALSAAFGYPTESALVVIEAVPVLALGLGGAFLAPWLVGSWGAVRDKAPVLR